MDWLWMVLAVWAAMFVYNVFNLNALASKITG